jgi:hypothetical protein
MATTPYVNISGVRKEIAGLLAKYNRFKKDVGVRKKMKKIDEHIKEIFYDDFIRKNAWLDQKVQNIIVPHVPWKGVSTDRKNIYFSKPINKDKDEEWRPPKGGSGAPYGRLSSVGNTIGVSMYISGSQIGGDKDAKHLKESPTMESIRSSDDDEIFDEAVPQLDRSPPRISKQKIGFGAVAMGNSSNKLKKKVKTHKKIIAYTNTVKIGEPETNTINAKAVSVMDSGTIDRTLFDRLKSTLSYEEKLDLHGSHNTNKFKDMFQSSKTTNIRNSRHLFGFDTGLLSRKKSSEKDTTNKLYERYDRYDNLINRIDKTDRLEKKSVDKATAQHKNGRIFNNSNNNSDLMAPISSNIKLPILKNEPTNTIPNLNNNLLKIQGAKNGLVNKKNRIDTQKSMKKIPELMAPSFAITPKESATGH